MPGLLVPELRRKLRMLVDYGHYPSMEAVARALDRSPVTLRGWASGASGTERNRIPERHIPALLDLYGRALPDLTAERVRQMLAGPAGDLEAVFAAQAAPSLRDLIEREADFDSGTVVLDAADGLSLIQLKSAQRRASSCEIERERYFRIEFTTRSHGGFAVALQSAPGGWGVVPCTLQQSEGRLHIPGLDEDGSPDFMCERSDTGLHRFIAAQGSHPFPPELASAMRDGITLDRTLLGHCAQNYEAQDKSTRRLFAINVRIVKPKEENASN